jgi:hypothetical protein
MFARVTSAQASPEEMQKSLGYLKEQAIPALEAQAGFKRLYFLLDRKTGKGLSVAFWETEGNLRASEAAYVGKARSQVSRELGVSIPTVEVYEVAVQA